MKTYIALLRGINVGGNNKVDMKQLKAAFLQAGFSKVRTYINSGNVIFASARSEAELAFECEAIIYKTFALNIAVALVTAEELAEALSHAPGWWGKDEEAKHNAIFVIPPATAQTVFDEMGGIKPEYESIAFHGKVIFWSAPLATFSRTRYGSIAKRSTYQHVTVRNENTTRKLAELASENCKEYKE